MQGEEEELPILNHSQMLNHVSFYNSINETWLHEHRTATESLVNIKIHSTDGHVSEL